MTGRHEDNKGRYPEGLDLTPGSEHSAVICAKVKERVGWSDEARSGSIPRWHEMDRVLTAYMPADAYDQAAVKRDPRKQLTFVVPMTFAMRETFQTVFVDTFCREDAIHLIKGVGSPDARVYGALYERALARQSDWFKERLHMDTVVGDAVTYGRGHAVLRWKKLRGPAPVTEEVDELLALALLGHGHRRRVGEMVTMLQQDRILREGTEMVPVSPYDAVSDPRVGVNNLDDSEFVGWRWGAGLNLLLRWERDPEERFFNGTYLREQRGPDSGYGDEFDWIGRDQRGGDGKSSRDTESAPGQLDLLTMCVDFIPADWFGEGHPDEPQKWQFTIAPDGVVVQAFKLDHWHGQFPRRDLALNDGHLAAQVSHLQTTYAFQKFSSWLMKSRAEAVLTLLNGKVFVDNSKVEIRDMLKSGVGGVVRVNGTNYGDFDVRKAVHQFDFRDPTVNHMQNIAEIDQIARNGIGVGDMVQGRMDALPDRPTKSGLNTAFTQMAGRLARLCLIADEQFMRDVGWQMAFNTQQWMGREVFVPIAGGRYEQELRRRFGVPSGDADIAISPGALNIAFEIESRTALRPGVNDQAAMAELVKTVLAGPGVLERFSAEYRVTDLIAQAFAEAGIKNMEDFRAGPGMDAQVMQDEDVLAQAEAGNLVPVGGSMA